MVRARPCRLRASRESSSRTTSTFPSFTSTFTLAGRFTDSLPLGPSKLTFLPATVAFVLSPSLIGSFPMRLMMASLVDGAEQLAADVLLARLSVGHDALGRREHSDTHAAE